MPLRRVSPLVLLGWLLVVVVAALLRLGDLGLVEFKYDEARVAQLADLLAHHGQVPATSIVTSAGVQNSPLAIYLLAPAALASWHPEVLTGYVGLLNTVAVALTGLMVTRYWGARAGLASGLLYAAAPLAVHYSRKIWAPELMPILSVVCLWCLIAAFAERRFWLVVPAAAAWSALVQLHQAAIWLAPIFVVLAVVGWRAVRPVPLVLSALAGFLVAAPYLAYEAQHHWDDLRQLLALAGKHGAVSAAPWWYAWALATGWGIPSFLGPPEHVLDPAATSRTWLDALGLALVAAGAVTLLVQTVPKRGARCRELAALAVLLWALLPPLGLTRAALPVFPHYLIYWYPALFALAGIGIDRLAVITARLAGGMWQAPGVGTPPWERGRPARPVQEGGTPALPGRRDPVVSDDAPGHNAAAGQAGSASLHARRASAFGAVVALVLVAVVVSGDALRTIQFRAAVATGHGGGEYGAPLRDSEAMVARTLAASGPSRRYVADRGDLPAVYRYLNRGGGAAYVEPDLALALPPPGSAGVYVYPPGTFRSLDALRALPGMASARAPGAYRLLEAPAGSSLALPPGVQPARYTTAAGLDLIGWEGASSARAGAPYTLTLWWRVAEAGKAPPGELKVFTHLLDAKRQTVAQHDALGYPPAYWTPGERVATFFTLQVPATAAPGSYHVVAGLYTLPGFAGAQVTGPAGESLGTEIPLATLAIT